MITLYGSNQSRSFRALWALEETGIEYQYHKVEIGRTTENGTQTEQFKKLNYQGKVPALVHDDFVINESAAIVNYINAISPEANLIPSDIKQRGRYDEICFFVLSDLEQPLWNFGKHSFVLPKQYRIKEMKDVAHIEFAKSIDALEAYLAGDDFAVGDKFSMADILIVHTLVWAQAFKFHVPDSLLKYMERHTNRSAYISALNKQ